MQSRSIIGASFDQVKEALGNTMSGGFSPTLAIVFISIKQDRKAVAGLLSQNNIDVFGATSSGEFINGRQTDGQIVILLLDLSRDAYTILFEEIGNSTITESATALTLQAKQQFGNPGMIVCCPGANSNGDYFDGQALVAAISKELGEEKAFYGGMAGDDLSFSGAYVFTKDRETDYGIVALILDENKISMQGMVIGGWKPMGISRKVTRSIGNLVYTIDDSPAVEMYFKYLGKAGQSEDKNFDVMNELSFHYPFIADRGDGETIIKSPMKIDHKENALVIDMEMEEGSTFWFSSPPDFEISQEIVDEATELKSTTQSEADALLIFSCAGRPPVLGPLVSLENDGLAEVWQTPMAGFFSYGEFGKAKNGKQHFHSSVCCWVALKEK